MDDSTKASAKSASTEATVQIVDGIEAVRRRPASYVGNLEDGTGLYALLWEVVGNALDQHLLRRASELEVSLTYDDGGTWVTVRDDGPGISAARVAQRENRPGLEVVFTMLHPGPSLGLQPHAPLAASMRGVGLATVNALCAELVVETTWEGRRYRQEFAKGRPLAAMTEIPARDQVGTTVSFRPDPTIFGEQRFDADTVAQRLRQVAWLYPWLQLTFAGQRLWARGGLAGWLEVLAAPHGGLRESFATWRMHRGMWVDVALGWTDDPSTLVRSFANARATSSGSHVAGLWEGLARWSEVLLRAPSEVDAAWSGGESERSGESLSPERVAAIRDVLAPGLIAVIHVGSFSSVLRGQRGEHLNMPDVEAAVAELVAEDGLLASVRQRSLRKWILDRLAVLRSGSDHRARR